MMQKFEAAVFDMDGTILDTLSDLTESTNFALKKHGYPIRTTDEVRTFVGNGIHKLIERAVPEGLDKDNIDAVHKTFLPHYSAHCMDNTRPYPGVVPLLQKLKAAGVKTAVVTNKSDAAAQELVNLFFDGLFDVSVGEREGLNKKPAPDEVDLALKTLNVPREKAVYIGDSDVDIMTAKNSGLPCISVTWGFRTRGFLISHGATVFADTPDEVFKLITKNRP